MAKSVRILQIGDIHLPEWPTEHSPIDDKDKNFSREIKADLVNQPLRSILKRINELAASSSIDAAVCVGDFTTRGATNQIRPAVEIMHHLLTDHYAPRPTAKFAVPGNHDVSKTDALEKGPIEKFHPLESALSDFGWPPPPIDDCLRYQIETADGLRLPIHLLNSSIGSWSTHLLPTSIADQINNADPSGQAISLNQDETEARHALGLSQSKPYSSIEDQVYDQMDTPYFPASALETLKGYMEETDDDTVLVVAHHNLLPQTIPRITHYSELLNAGQVRRFFQNANKTVIYLHGHIHDDPVERVAKISAQVNQNNDAEIISISAPVVWNGFNELCLFFDEDGKIFLIRVTEYRPDEFGIVGNFSDQRSRYIPVRSRIENLMTPQVHRVWGSIRDKRAVSWREIVQLAKDQSLNEDEVEHALLSLFCCSLVQIGHLGRERTRWRIKANEVVS